MQLDQAAEQPGRHARAVDGQDDAGVVRGRAHPGSDAVRGRTLLDAVVQHRERQVERIGLLADHEHLLADLGEHAVRAFGEPRTAESSERLRRAEARRRSAEQQHAGDC